MTLKRTVDVVAATVGLVLLGPVLAIIAVIVRVTMGRPVLFRQVRPGLHAEPFEIFKFRTMRDAVDATGCPLPDEERLTPVGLVLRSTSLDELPALLNVLRGDMSLVGPRPLLMEYVPRYSKRQARRMEVRPGVTGLAQVAGRNQLSWDEKFELDVWYVDHHDLRLDMKILAMTVGRVLSQSGISAEGHATAPVFQGDDEYPPS
jgi:sugar transferase EpsL